MAWISVFRSKMDVDEEEGYEQEDDDMDDDDDERKANLGFRV